MFAKVNITYYFDKATIENIGFKKFETKQEFYDFCLDNVAEKINAVANKPELCDLMTVEAWDPLTGTRSE